VLHHRERSTIAALSAGLCIVFGALAACGTKGASPTTSPTSSPPSPSLDNVVIAVVDDFDAPGTDDQPSGAASANCTYPSNDVGSKGGSGGPLPPGVAHGAVVYRELLDAFNGVTTFTPKTAASPGTYADPSWQWIRTADAWTVHERTVVLLAVDTRAYSTTEVTDHIDKLMAYLNPRGFTRFVLNLSFIVAPCDPDRWWTTATPDLAAQVAAYRKLISDAGSSDLALLEQKLNELVSAGTDAQGVWTALAQWRGALSPLTQLLLLYSSIEESALNHVSDDALLKALTIDDPLNKAITEWTQTRRVVPVGAAGNGLSAPAATGDPSPHPLNFPFAPALWNSVVSASASGQAGRAAYSNSGEVMLDGEFAVPAGTMVDQGFTVEGTSFAAPRLSYAEAIYLLNGGPVHCGDEVPPLGYTDVEGGELGWNNLPLPDAITAHCSAFGGLMSAT
jgi:hypothetical protein